MLSQKLFLQILKAANKIKSSEINAYQEKAKKSGKELEQFMLDEKAVDETELYGAVAKKFDLPFVEIKNKEIKKDVLNLIPPPLAQTHHMVAFDKNKKEISIALLDPEDLQTIEFVHRKTGLIPKLFVTSPGDIKDALRRYHADLESDLSIKQLSEGESETGTDLKKAAEELPIVNIVNSVLEHAVYEGASDIHIEPGEKEVVVRYRVDGLLKNVMTLPKTVKNGIIARVKILANLKIDEHMTPQDGRFKIQIQEEKLAFRVSVIPVYDGEKIVMRLLHEGQKPLTLDQLGFLPEAKKIMEKAIESPHGMILVTGPTGSGKTTTLYSVLGILNQPDVNICTIEDPIEYRVSGINQSQVNPKAGFTFASGLRSFLRQDPDIIMVGEIRDQETAEMAIHSAMTGHLVLSTLHTNDAPTTIPRLVDMNIPPFLIAFTTNVVIAQRLVRKICEHCKKQYSPDKAILLQLEQMVNTKKMFSVFKENKIKLEAKEKKLSGLKFFQGEGCHRCGKSGYKGRIGIYEVLPMDRVLTEKISHKATADEIKDYMIKKGYLNMLEDGLVKAKLGITTLEEILRVTKE